MNRSKRFHITTYGCQMNEYDSERITRILSPLGYEYTENEREADLILVNTCSIREKAEQKVYSHLGRLKSLKKKKPGTIIGVGGCVAQQHGNKLLERIDYVDLVFGTHTLVRLPEMISQIATNGKRLSFTDYTYDFDLEPDKLHVEKTGVKALLTIMRGCNNFCTYCIVPYVRGREVSRPKADIIHEAKTLIDNGVKEITLLGQNVNSYRPTGADYNFASLLRDLNELPGLERMRFITSHPKDLTEDLVRVFAEIEKVCHHIHLPVQSGSTKILRRMKRGYTRKAYLEKIDQLRKVCPDISITTDIIVGFPGEDERDFHDTLDLMREVQFESAFSFKYSDRQPTKAASFTDKVPEEIKSQRLKILQSLQDEITLKRISRLEGRIEPILVEGWAKKTPNKLTGRTNGNHVVNFFGEGKYIGRMVPVLLVKCFLHSISGKLLEAA